MKTLGTGLCLWDFYLTGEPLLVDDNKFPTVEECRGKILFTHIPSPDVVLYMSDALAVVAETGGVLCHAAVLALELGCPIIVAAEGVMAKVKGKKEVALQGSNGQGIIYAKETL